MSFCMSFFQAWKVMENDGNVMEFLLSVHVIVKLLYMAFNKDCNLITLRAKLSSTVYCNRSCLCVCVWVCYHDNSKSRASMG